MTPQYSVGAEQVAAHLKACTESREELLAALKAIVDDAICTPPDALAIVEAGLIHAARAVIAKAEASRV